MSGQISWAINLDRKPKLSAKTEQRFSSPDARNKQESCAELCIELVREVGFEPTNPYGTGASGLRVQDPTSIRRVSLTWLGNTSRPIDKADSRKHQARSRKNT